MLACLLLIAHVYGMASIFLQLCMRCELSPDFTRESNCTSIISQAASISGLAPAPVRAIHTVLK